MTRVAAGDLLAALNACMNASAAILAFTGWRRIKRGDRSAHKRLMLSALGVSALFLVGYLTRVGLTGTHRYPGSGAMRAAYLALLSSHMLLAVATPPLVVGAAWLALRGRFEAHRRLVRYALPVWLYVSVTGVLVYAMLYGALAS
jgi:putative membrane protein